MVLKVQFLLPRFTHAIQTQHNIFIVPLFPLILTTKVSKSKENSCTNCTTFMNAMTQPPSLEVKTVKPKP